MQLSINTNATPTSSHQQWNHTSKHLLALYEEQSLTYKVRDVEAFQRQFNFWDHEIFGEAEYRAVEGIFERWRPSEFELPSDDSILQLHSYVKEQIQEISKDFKMEKLRVS